MAYTVCRVAESDSYTKQTLWHCLCVYASPSVLSPTRETKVTCWHWGCFVLRKIVLDFKRMNSHPLYNIWKAPLNFWRWHPSSVCPSLLNIALLDINTFCSKPMGSKIHDMAYSTSSYLLNVLTYRDAEGCGIARSTSCNLQNREQIRLLVCFPVCFNIWSSVKIRRIRQIIVLKKQKILLFSL